MSAPSKSTIRAWMRLNAADHTDGRTGEVNCTSLVEAWDAEKGSGEETLDPDHPAWEVAVEVARAAGDRS